MAKKTPPKKGSADGAGGARPAAAKKGPSASEAELKRLDKELVKLLNKRSELAVKLLQAHPQPHKAVFDPAGDDELWQELEEGNPGPLTGASLRYVYRELLSAARRMVKIKRVAYLGPEYSFSHLAAVQRFGSSVDFLPVTSIAAVFEAVNRGQADFGVVPIENSTDGRIVDTLEMFTRLPLKICAEVQLRVHHHLLSKCPIGEITEIYSKPQAFSQCREWLSRNLPQATQREVTSTATAAQLAQAKKGAAAIASREAATVYGLQSVAENIEDNKHNSTRFAVIGEEATSATGKDKTAVLVQIPHKPGTLADTLQIFKNNKINLTWIESFPLKGPEEGYQFFLDFEGHASEARVKRTLEELAKKAVVMSRLGSYPKSKPVD